MIAHEALRDTRDAIRGIVEVIIPDHLDELDEPDWELIELLRSSSILLHDATLATCDRYRDMLAKRRPIGGGVSGAPVGADILSLRPRR